jgi:hypothetical protein
VCRIVLFLAFTALFSTGLSAQNTQQPPLPPQDPQAVNILNQVLGNAGGVTAITAVTDYTATGNVTYHWGQGVEGSVTVLGLGSSELRVDAALPNGMRSMATDGGQTTIKSEAGVMTHMPPQYAVIPSSDAFPYQAPLFPASQILPYLQIVSALGAGDYSIAYKGTTTLAGQSVYDVQIQLDPQGQTTPDIMAEYHTIDLFIGTSNLQIAMTQDSVPRHITHQIQYSNYTTNAGILVPLSIAETMSGQPTWNLQLTQFSFNTGLQESAFVIQ